MGGIDILVNNAGMTRDNLFLRMKDEEWDDVLAVNLTAAFHLSRSVLRGMLRARWGRIISITSVVGVAGNAGQANYAASKAGLIGFSKSLAQEVARRGWLTAFQIKEVAKTRGLGLRVAERYVLIDILGEGQGDEAVGHQGRALEALRKGAKDMMKQMQAMQGDQGGSQEGGRQQNADRDPLGRPRASQGPDFGDSVKVPDEIDVQRARQILEAIRKRLGNALSPDIERSYLERLLELK